MIHVQTELVDMAKRILELRELGQKRDARELIRINKIDGSDLLHALETDPKTGHFDPADLVGVITMMDSVLDETRDCLQSAKRRLNKIEQEA